MVKSNLVSEVGFFTGDGPEGDLFALLKNDIIATERPVRDENNIILNLRESKNDESNSLNCKSLRTSSFPPDVLDGVGEHGAYIWA